MSAPLTATVVRTWQGVSGRYWAHVLVAGAEKHPATIQSLKPFAEGQRVELELVGHDYRLKSDGRGV